jgi:hypothetical protein
MVSVVEKVVAPELVLRGLKQFHRTAMIHILVILMVVTEVIPAHQVTVVVLVVAPVEVRAVARVVAVAVVVEAATSTKKVLYSMPGGSITFRHFLLV